MDQPTPEWVPYLYRIGLSERLFSYGDLAYLAGTFQLTNVLKRLPEIARMPLDGRLEIPVPNGKPVLLHRVA